MKALILGTKICQLSDAEFPVHNDLVWVEVPNDTTTDHTLISGVCVRKPEPTQEVLWLGEIKDTDKEMPRWLEDHIEADHKGVAANPFQQSAYNKKKEIRQKNHKIP